MEFDDVRWQEVIPLYCGVATRNEVSAFLKSLASQSNIDIGRILCESYGTAAREVGRDSELHDLVATRVLRCLSSPGGIRMEVFKANRLGKLANEIVISLDQVSPWVSRAFQWLLSHPVEVDWDGIAVRLKKPFVSNVQFLEIVHLCMRFAPLEREDVWRSLVKLLRRVANDSKGALVENFELAFFGICIRNSMSDSIYYPANELSKGLRQLRHQIFATLLDCLEICYNMPSRAIHDFDWLEFAKLIVIDTEPGSTSLQEKARTILFKNREASKSELSSESHPALEFLTSKLEKRGKVVPTPNQPRITTRKKKP